MSKKSVHDVSIKIKYVFIKTQQFVVYFYTENRDEISVCSLLNISAYQDKILFFFS